MLPTASFDAHFVSCLANYLRYTFMLYMVHPVCCVTENMHYLNIVGLLVLLATYFFLEYHV